MAERSRGPCGLALAWRHAVPVLALVLVVEMPLGEFIAVQEMNDRERRRRFELPETCDPIITAVRAARERVQVMVTCARPDDEGSEPDRSA